MRRDRSAGVMEIIKRTKEILSCVRSVLRNLFARRSWGQIYYINGPDVLPAPLEREEEEAILAEIAQDEKEENGNSTSKGHQNEPGDVF